MRDYVPVYSTNVVGANILFSQTNYARYIVLGRMVMGLISMNIQLSGTPITFLDFTVPTPISDLSTGIFIGDADQKLGFAAPILVFSTNKLSVKKYDGSTWLTGDTTRMVGFFCYENGEDNE